MPSNLRRRRPGHSQGQQQPVRHFKDAQSQTESPNNKRQQQQQRSLRRPLTRAVTAKNGIDSNRSDSLKNVQQQKCDSNQDDVVMTHETSSVEKELDPIQAEKLINEHVQKNVLELLENDLCCAICREIYINPVILNCSHSFCKFCLNAWLAKHDKCPTCRIDAIFHSENLALRDIVTKMIVKMSAQYQEARSEALKAREQQEEAQNKTLPALRPRARNQANQGWTANGIRESETRPIQRWTGLNGATIWRTPLNTRSRRGETDDEIDFDDDEYLESDDEDDRFGWIPQAGPIGRRVVPATSDEDDDYEGIGETDEEDEEEEEDEEDVLEDDPDEDVDANGSDTESEEDSDTDIVVEMDDEDDNEPGQIRESDSGDEEEEEEEEDDDEERFERLGEFDFFYDNYVDNLRGDMYDDLYSQWTIDRHYFDTGSSDSESSTSNSSNEERTERLSIESTTSDSDSSDSSSTDDEDASDYVPTRRRIRGARR